ncbi:MAG: hypothetical protein AB1779_00870 [Candidatus Thermoplasmatota archaeon]
MQGKSETVEKVELDADKVITSLARMYGRSKDEVIELLQKKYGGNKSMGDRTEEVLEKLKKVIGERGGKERDSIDKLVDYKIVEKLTDDGTKTKKKDEEDMGSMNIEKMMMLAMLPQLMKGMSGGDSEIGQMMKWKYIAKMDEGKGDMEKLEAMLKSEREARKEEQKIWMEAMFGKKETEKILEKIDAVEERTKERIAYLEDLALRGGKGEEKKNPIIEAADTLETAKKSLETVGAIEPKTEEERKHQLQLEEYKAGKEKEMKLMEMVNERLGNFEKSIDKKLDMLLSMFLNEQRLRAAQAGIQVPGEQPQAPISREEMYRRMQEAAEGAGGQGGQS